MNKFKLVKLLKERQARNGRAFMELNNLEVAKWEQNSGNPPSKNSKNYNKWLLTRETESGTKSMKVATKKSSR